MYKPRPCGCKGVRTCLICEKEFGIEKHYQDPTISQGGDGGLIKDSEHICETDKEIVYEYCYLCDKIWKGSHVRDSHPNYSCCSNQDGQSFSPTSSSPPDSRPFPGILLMPDFLSPAEELALVDGCDSMDWDLSQSGRRKQNFGPKTNFKKKKINGSSFNGFPSFSKFVQDKLIAIPLLSDFQTIEQCSIEYRPETGAHIDPHIDDCWVWGERVVSVSLLSDSILTMNKYNPGAAPPRYNLLDFYNEKNTSTTTTNGIDQNGHNDDDGANSANIVNNNNNSEEGSSSYEGNIIVRIPMPRRSLLVLYGPARYEWEHSVLRSDISARRICLAYREFTKEYLKDGKYFEEVGLNVLNRAKMFW